MKNSSLFSFEILMKMPVTDSLGKFQEHDVMSFILIRH